MSTDPFFLPLTPKTPCREVVRKTQSFCSELKLRMPGPSNVAYCKARGRLPSEDLKAVHSSVSERLLARVREDQRWLGRDVKVVDGTGIRLVQVEVDRQGGLTFALRRQKLREAIRRACGLST